MTITKNNAKYANYVINALNPGPEGTVKTFQLDYRYEVLPGKPLDIYTLVEDGRVLSKGVREDGKTEAANLPFLRDQSADAVLIGCGMSVCNDTRALVRGFLEACDKPLLLDADALNCLADDPSVLRRVKAPVVITPHPAEMGRLLGVSAGEVNADREMTAKRFAADYGVIVVLKGAGTVTAAPDGRAVINTTGNSGMATGGSGDVLAGICASLLAQGGEPFACAAAAVYLHGLAGDLAAARLGKISMLPTDLLDALPQAFLSVQRSGKER